MSDNDDLSIKVDFAFYLRNLSTTTLSTKGGKVARETGAFGNYVNRFSCNNRLNCFVSKSAQLSLEKGKKKLSQLTTFHESKLL